METEWPSRAGTRDWARDRQGGEAPWPIDLAQKDTQRKIKPHMTPRDRAEHRESREDAQGTGDRRTRRKPLGTVPVEAGRGGRICVGGGSRQRKEGTIRWDNPWV